MTAQRKGKTMSKNQITFDLDVIARKVLDAEVESCIKDRVRDFFDEERDSSGVEMVDLWVKAEARKIIKTNADKFTPAIEKQVQKLVADAVKALSVSMEY